LINDGLHDCRQLKISFMISRNRHSLYTNPLHVKRWNEASKLRVVRIYLDAKHAKRRHDAITRHIVDRA